MTVEPVRLPAQHASTSHELQLKVDFQRDVFCLLGLPFDAVNMAGAVEHVREAAAQRTPCLISTPNLNFLINCLTDDRFRDSVINSDLSIADGMPLIWIARLMGIPIRTRVAGSDLFEELRKESSTPLAVYLFGGMAGVAEAACRRLNAESAGVVCVGYEFPGLGSIQEMSGDASIGKINASNADFLLVALGASKGQAWIMHNLARISVPVISHLGAVLNFVAGTVNRAPAWIQKTGLEWLWRIKEEPMLWRRYFGDGLAFVHLLATRVLPYAWYLRKNRRTADLMATASIEAWDEKQYYIIRLQGPWTRMNIAALRDCFARAVLAEKDIKLDTSNVTYVDSAFVGLTILLQGHQKQQGRQLLIDSPPQNVCRVIRYCCAEYLCLPR